jgi:hypothetical protein
MFQQIGKKPAWEKSPERIAQPKFSIELRLPATDNTQFLARELKQVFTSCGFHCESVRTLSAPARGVRIQSHPSLQGPAQLISAAFDTARIAATTDWNPALQNDVLVITVGHSQAF